MDITSRIDEYLTRKEKKVIKESIDNFESDLNADLMELLNSLEDDYLDDSQIALRDKLLASNFTVVENPGEAVEDEDFMTEPEEEEEIDLFGEPEETEEEFVDDTEINDIDVPEELGDSDLYGYDETDVTIAENKKTKRKNPFIAYVKKNKS